jgi:hypothetical protein
MRPHCGQPDDKSTPAHTELADALLTWINVQECATTSTSGTCHHECERWQARRGFAAQAAEAATFPSDDQPPGRPADDAATQHARRLAEMAVASGRRVLGPDPRRQQQQQQQQQLPWRQPQDGGPAHALPSNLGPASLGRRSGAGRKAPSKSLQRPAVDWGDIVAAARAAGVQPVTGDAMLTDTFGYGTCRAMPAASLLQSAASAAALCRIAKCPCIP